MRPPSSTTSSPSRAPSPEASSPVWIGVDLGGTNLRVMAIGRGGGVRRRIDRPTPRGRRVGDVVAAVLDAIHALPPHALRAVAGAAMGVPGAIRQPEGTVTQSPNFPSWHEVPLRRRLERGLGVQVLVENDANLATFGEARLGAARGLHHVALLTLGTGVGGGLVLHGQLFRGVNGMAGELGHLPVDPRGPRCGCGATGCLEQYASATAIRHADPRGREVPILARAARRGEPEARAIFREAGRAIGFCAATLANALNLEMLLVAGGVAATFDLLAPAARRELHRRAFRIPGATLRIRKATLGADAGLLGAAHLAADQFPHVTA